MKMWRFFFTSCYVEVQILFHDYLDPALQKGQRGVRNCKLSAYLSWSIFETSTSTQDYMVNTEQVLMQKNGKASILTTHSRKNWLTVQETRLDEFK